MIDYLKAAWSAVKEIQDLRAKRILKGHYWY